MNVTYTVSADSLTRANEIAKAKAKADGWTTATVVRTEQVSAREYEVYMLVSKHN